MRMPNTVTQRRMTNQTKVTRQWLTLLCACVLWTSGCFLQKAPVRPRIVVMGFAHPVVPASTALAELEPPPDLPFEVPLVPLLATSRSMPAKPHVAPLPASEPIPAEKAAEPIIAPALTTEELATAKTATQQNLQLVEKNLTLVRGRTLNATQQDLISKVRGFTDNAREAMYNGDWVRARNLSKKAEVLSEQLAASL
jgi:hypothetical protein